MDKKTLLQRLSDIEWDDFEVKQSTHDLPANAWETVSAFSNTSGGWLVLGVTQTGKKFEITGLANPAAIEQNFTTTLRSRGKFNILINPECKKYKIDGKTVLAFHIPSSEQKPVYFNTLQNTYIRSASGDQRATNHEINALLREQSFGAMSAKPAPRTSIKSLSKASYKNFRDYLKRMIPDLPYNRLADPAFNQKLQITKDGKLTYGGLLFLGDNEQIQNHFPDFRVDYLEIPGTSYTNAEPRYTFRIPEQENLWEYYFALFQRLRIYADAPLYIGDMGIGHEDNKLVDALREGLINMLMHCDYFSPMRPRIRVFTNRIEFENPGTLPRPLKELMKVDVSVLRNPVLAKLFRTAKLCENAGYGIDKMLVWKTETRRKVLIESSIDMTKVTFMLDTQKSAHLVGEMTTGKQPEKVPEKMPEKRTEKQPEKQPEKPQIKPQIKPQENYKKTTKKSIKIEKRILALLNSALPLSMPEMAARIGVSYSSLRHHLEKLKSHDTIRREGSRKDGKWIIISAQSNQPNQPTK
jgi:ATP-dependent DNA helicase RecG